MPGNLGQAKGDRAPSSCRYENMQKENMPLKCWNNADCSPGPVKNTLSHNPVLENQKAFALSTSGTLRYLTQTVSL